MLSSLRLLGALAVLLLAALAIPISAASEEAPPGASPAPSRDETRAAPGADALPATPPPGARPGAAAKESEPAGEAAEETPFEALRRKALRARLRGVRGPEIESAPEMLHPWWGWYPWYGIPQTVYYRDYYPPSITHVPRLGLQHNYPFAYQMGLRIPDDADPLTEEHSPANLGPFVGVVGALKALAEAEGSEADEAFPLIQEKKYKEAGRMLAEGYRESDDPRYPILLAEVFFLLGKYDHAEALLRQGLASKDGAQALPEEIGSHLAAGELDQRLQEIGDKPRLVTAYMLIHSKEPAKGTDMLERLARESPQDKAVAALYRRYVAKAL